MRNRWRLAVLAFGGLMLAAQGCSTPTMSSKERFNAWGRNMSLEWQMLNDDIDKHVLQTRPLTLLHADNVK